MVPKQDRAFTDALVLTCAAAGTSTVRQRNALKFSALFQYKSACCRSVVMTPHPMNGLSPVDSPDTTVTTDDGRLARGRQRMRELIIEDETARQAVADGLIRDLGRTPGAGELLLIESIASQVVEARKLRRQGRSSEMQDRLIYRGIARLGIKEGPATPRLSYVEKIEAREAAQRAAAAQGTADRSGDTETAADSNERTGASGAQPGEASEGTPCRS